MNNIFPISLFGYDLYFYFLLLGGSVAIYVSYILFRYYLFTRSWDFLFGFFIFLGTFLNIFGLLIVGIGFPFSLDDITNIMHIEKIFISNLFFYQIIFTPLIITHLAIVLNALSIRWTETNKQINLVILAFFIILSVFLFIFLFSYDVSELRTNRTWWLWEELFRASASLFGAYSYYKLHPAVNNQSMHRIRYVYVFTFIFGGFSSGVQQLISTGYFLTTDKFALQEIPLFDFYDFLVQTLLGSFVVIVILYYVIRHPQVYLISQSQILRARNIYKRVTDEKNEFPENSVTNYLKTIPPSIFNELSEIAN